MSSISSIAGRFYGQGGRGKDEVIACLDHGSSRVEEMGRGVGDECIPRNDDFYGRGCGGSDVSISS